MVKNALPPNVRGLLESVARGLSGRAERKAWIRSLGVGLVRAYVPGAFREWEVWVGEVPVWVCTRCDGVFFAPSGEAVVGSADEHYRWCAQAGAATRSRGKRWEVRVRYRDPGKTEWDVRRFVRKLGGTAPYGRMRGSNRADEGWFEVWLKEGTEAQLLEWDRAREVRPYTG